MTIAAHPRSLHDVHPSILQLLGHRFGDGLVYLLERRDRSVYQRAVSLGLVSAEGYLTPLGASMVARHHID